ncbi:MAG: hypothetical protein ACW96M_07990 [Candidatus Thorarchaeota archaeon]
MLHREGPIRIEFRQDDRLKKLNVVFKMEPTDIGSAIIAVFDDTCGNLIQTMNPNLKLERSKTLMDGHDQCNHTFIWEE